LIAAIISREGHCADDSIPVYNGRPHIQTKAGVFRASDVHDRFQRRCQLSVTREIFGNIPRLLFVFRATRR